MPNGATTLLSTYTLKDMTDLVEKRFTDPASKPDMRAMELYKIENIGMNTGDSRRFEEFDTETFAKRKPEAEAVKKARAGLGYSKSVTMKRFGVEIDITWELRMLNKYSTVSQKISSLSGFYSRRLDIDLTHFLTFAGSTSYVNMDGEVVDLTTANGQALVSAGQTLAFSSDTYSNSIGNVIFSETTLETAETMLINNIKSNFGEKRSVNMNKIVTSEYMPVVNEVKRLLQSTARITAPNAGVVNVYESKYKHIILPYLATDAKGNYDVNKKNYWFLLSDECSGYVGIWETENLVTPSAGNNLEDRHKDIWTYGVRGSHGAVWVSGRGLLGALCTL
jgi:hypothetical protein